MERSEAGTLVAKLFAFFPGSKTTDDTFAAYVSALEGFECADYLAEAVNWAVMEARFLPTVAEIAERYWITHRREVEIAEREELALRAAERPALAGEVGDSMSADLRERLSRLVTTPDPVVMTREEIEREGQPEPVKVPPWPHGLPTCEPDPIEATNGPRCAMGHGPTVHNGGSLWWCQTCGWVTRREAAKAVAK